MSSRYLLSVWAVVRDGHTLNAICFSLPDPLHLKRDLITSNKENFRSVSHENFPNSWEEAGLLTHSAPSSSSQFPKQGPPPARAPMTRSFFSTRMPWRSPRFPPASSAPSKAPINSSLSCQSSSPPNLPAIFSDSEEGEEDCCGPPASPDPLLSTITSGEERAQTASATGTSPNTTLPFLDSSLNLKACKKKRSYTRTATQRWHKSGLTLKEQRVLDSRDGRWLLPVIAALPFLQLNAELVLSHTGSTLWIDTNQISVIWTLPLLQTWKQSHKTAQKHRRAFFFF